MITAYQAQYYAHDLTKRCSANSLEKLTGALMDAQVDLNPHQVEAALFAFKSPLSGGAILADEVGLGKTIEAGLVISQKWAEGKKRILIISPSSLRKQWNQELLDKFFIPSVIMEAKSYNQIKKQSPQANPFEQNEIVICSYNFVANKDEDVMITPWDLVIIDEAHRLRNVYKTSNKIAKKIKAAIATAPKVLLTATPLQNSLMELYGLVSFIDEYAFGDAKSFRAQYARITTDETFQILKSRLKPLCQRTLRRQVLEYIKYTNRVPITQEFTPSADEDALYDMVSDYLRRDNLQALPASQRKLMTLVLRKLLASSTFAIAGALDSLINKLKSMLKSNDRLLAHYADLGDDEDIIEELRDEYGLTEDEDLPEPLSSYDIAAVEGEITDLETFRDLATSITQNAKGLSLLEALKTGFEKAQSLGALDKAIIFTESRRTQNYLVSLLEENGYADKIVLFNGSNNDPQSREIYSKWVERNKGTDRYSGSRTADMRSALIDHFRDHGQIMIATEAAAEGVNLQFCSLLVNYDLPWNPQRIEQRIGRCHRYGQKHDVVVINFLNKNNEADQRVYELLSEKFHLFNGVFGASDEILGAIESGVDFEQRVMDIYQNCRTEGEIGEQFDLFRQDMEEQITEAIDNTRQKLLENFDAEVHDKLRMNLEESQEYLNKYEQRLLKLTHAELNGHAEYRPDINGFDLVKNPFPEKQIKLGTYRVGRHVDDAHVYRIGHPLAKGLIEQAVGRELQAAHVEFDYTNHPQSIEAIKPLVGQSGTLALHKLTIASADTEDHLIFSAFTDSGEALTQEQAERIFALPATVLDQIDGFENTDIQNNYTKRKTEILEEIGTRNASFFEAEMDKLDAWADDKRVALKTNLKELEDEIKELKKQARFASSLPEKIELQKKAKNLEPKRDQAWQAYEAAAREIEDKKDSLLDNVEARLQQHIDEQQIFTIKWTLK
ncbi:MAG: SNF2-related protein [Pseudomonadota bacterium]|nr:SNF2-related protein [Pseudomonadota bacterium]